MNKEYKTKLKFFLYARKSSESEDRQVQSTEDQIDRLKILANYLGLEIIEILEENKSAKNPNNRPVFNSMLDRIENGEAQGILCWQINRLSRNPVDSGRISWLLQQDIVKSIQTIDKEYLPTDNVILFNVESGVANQFIIELKKNTERGLEGKADRSWLPSRAPIGYLNDRLEHTIYEDPDRFNLVRKMWNMMLTGNIMPIQILQIATKEWGLKTVKTKHEGDKEFSESGIYRMFNNIFYTGMFKYNGKLYKGNHKPMITTKEFERVQSLLDKNYKPAKHIHDHSFTGIIICGECGCGITATEKQKFVKATGKMTTYNYYHCTKKKRHLNCKNPHISLEELESQIDLELAKHTIHPKFQEWALEIISKNNNKEIEDRTKIYLNQQKTINDTQSELDNLTRMRYKNQIEEEEFLKIKDELKNKLTKLQSNIKQTENRAEKWLELTEKTFNFCLYARQKFATGDPQTKREIFTALGENYTLKDKKLFIDKAEWFIPIQNAYPALKLEFDSLELDKTLTEQERNVKMQQIILTWGAQWELNPY